MTSGAGCWGDPPKDRACTPDRAARDPHCMAYGLRSLRIGETIPADTRLDTRHTERIGP